MILSLSDLLLYPNYLVLSFIQMTGAGYGTKYLAHNDGKKPKEFRGDPRLDTKDENCANLLREMDNGGDYF